MRMVRARLQDSYYVQKLYREYRLDSGHKDESTPEEWLVRLCDEAQRYNVLMHGRSPVGMVWGRFLTGEIKKTLVIEGAFLRRAHRGKMKFRRHLAKARRDLQRGAERVFVLKKAATLKRKGAVLLVEATRVAKKA